MRSVCNRAVAAVLSALGAVSPVWAQSKGSDGVDVQKCEQPIGSLSVVEPTRDILFALQRFSLESPTTLIRMMVQRSNCFTVLERGVGMASMVQERQLGASGELQQGSNMGKGQMRTADYVLTPTVLFSEKNAGGLGVLAGGLGRRLGGIAAVGGALKFKEAETTMLLADARSSVQVASAKGQARKRDFSLGALGWLGGIAGAAGGYRNTNEGKVIAASFVDNYNELVTAVRADPVLQRAAAGDASAKGDGVQAGASFNNGDVLGPKVAGIRLYDQPAESGKVLATLNKVDEVVFVGEGKNGFLKVEGAAGSGWVSRVLVVKR